MQTDIVPHVAAPSVVADRELLDIIRAEYREMPCLRLTNLQIQRLWRLDDAMCDSVIRVLQTQGFLKLVANRYVLAA